MTVSAGVWGYVLQMVPAKLLLTLGSAAVQFCKRRDNMELHRAPHPRCSDTELPLDQPTGLFVNAVAVTVFSLTMNCGMASRKPREPSRLEHTTEATSCTRQSF